jgi:hypothetical protein
MSAGLANIRSAAPVERIRQAIEARGFIVEPTDRAFPPRQTKSKVGARALLGVVGRALRLGLVCGLPGAHGDVRGAVRPATFRPKLRNSGRFRRLRDGTGQRHYLSIAPGAILGFLIALVHGGVRLANTVSNP